MKKYTKTYKFLLFFRRKYSDYSTNTKQKQQSI